MANKVARATRNLVPALYCPFPSVINRHADEVHAETVEWAKSFGLLEEESTYRIVRDTNVGRLAGRFHPDAPREQLRLVSDWCAWMFLRDDLADAPEFFRHPERLVVMDTRFLDLLKGEEPSGRDVPLGQAVADLRRRLIPKVPAALWMRRFIRSVTEHFESTLWESANRARGITPELSAYTRMRPITGGMNVDADFIELAVGIYLPPEVHGHKVVSSLTRMSNNAVCWANDIISLEKELARGDVHNLVLILRDKNGLDLRKAIKAAVEMHDAEVHTFTELEGNLPSFSPAVNANLERYVSILKARMRGNLDWSRESVRYRTSVG